MTPGGICLARWTATVLAVAVYGVMITITLPHLTTLAGGLAPFDLRPLGYGYEEARLLIEPPERPAAVSGQGASQDRGEGAGQGTGWTLVWSAPGQFLALSTGTGDGAAIRAARSAFQDAASVSDQSDGRFMVEVIGARARDVLSRLTVVDLDPALFPPGAAAATSIDHTTVNLWRKPDTADGSPVYAILMLTSFAASIWHSLHEAAEEFGVSTHRATLDEGVSRG